MQPNADLSVITLVVTVVMAVLQMAVLVWKGGELSQRVEHLENDFNTFRTEIRGEVNSLKGEVNTVKLDLTNLKSEVSFIKGMLSGWKNGLKEE
jgi:hypothetical protein